MLQFRLFNGGPLPSGLEGFIKAAANIGSVIGQIGFGKCRFTSDHGARRLVNPQSRVNLVRVSNY
jgi:MFS transporter, PHS family, inorganic phosphate transporter